MVDGILVIARSKEIITSKNKHNENILDEITNRIYEFCLNPEQLKDDTLTILSEIKKQFCENGDDALCCALECFVHNEIYDEIFCKIKEKFATEDWLFYEKCTRLSKNNVTPQQLGSKAYNIIPKLAVVELSMLENCRSPVEKLNCFFVVFDLIFAEMKASRIAIISQYSEKEIDIPIIETKEVMPVLMAVIIKSKLMYVFSNLDYIKLFDSSLKSTENISDPVKIFQEAIENITKFADKNLKEVNQLSPSLNVCEAIEFVNDVRGNEPNANDEEIIYTEEKRRVQDLLTTATTENLCNYT